MKPVKFESRKLFETKMKDSSEYRREVFLKLLQHVRSGKSLDCFGPLSEKAIVACVESHVEFDASELEEAMRDAKASWEDIGRKQSEGTCIGNSRSWYYNMSHRYGWTDKVAIDANVKGNVSVNVVSYASNNTCANPPSLSNSHC